MRKLIIIPAYNEEKSIEGVVERLKKYSGGYDYIVINDASGDNTGRILDEKGYDHIDLPLNLGIGGAVQTGYLYAVRNGYDIAIQMDGDGQHDPEYLDDMTAPIERGECDIAIGSRFIDKEGFQSSGMRRFGIGILSRLIRMVSRVRVADVTSGYRAVNARITELYSRHYPQDYPEPEAIVIAASRGARIREIPVRMNERTTGISSITMRKSIYYMIKVSIGIIVARITGRIGGYGSDK